MTRAVFEVATIADAIKSAERVAPSKGAAFDKSAGILIELDPAQGTVVVRATDTEIYHMAWIDTVELEGVPVTWRVPADLFSGVMSSLPIGSGKQVELTDTINGHARALHLNSNRTKCKFMLMDHSYYPEWGAFDPDNLFPARDLGGRISQVEWAAAKTEIPINGVHLDGEWAVCTDRYRAARVPLLIPDLVNPVTIPSGILGQILKQTGEVQIGVDGETFMIMPDEHTQIRSVIYANKYPNVKRIMKTDYPFFVKTKKTELLDVINRALNFQGNNRTPTIRVFFGNEEIACMMSDAERGLIGDVVEVPGQCVHDRFEVKFTPRNLVDAVSSSPNEEVVIGYDTDRSTGIVHVSGGSGYDAWVMPRMDLGEKDGV